MHRLAWHDPNRGENEVKESLILALLDAGETVMLQDENDQYVFIANLPSIWSSNKFQDKKPSDIDIFGPQIAETIVKAKNDLAVTGNRITIEISAGEEIYQFQFFSTVTADNRKVTKTTIRNVSVERRREQLLRTLLREVSHRSRNLMAIIQSLSDQTARFSWSKDEFLRKFRGRLHALAQSQDLLTDTDWRGANLHQLLRQQLDLYLPEYPHFVNLTGEDVFLNPNAAMYLGLAFHELVVNTVSHRRQFPDAYRISVKCRVEDGRVYLDWREPLPPKGDDESSSHPEHVASFGSVVLEKVVPVAVNGSARYEISGDEILYTIEFPLVPTSD